MNEMATKEIEKLGPCKTYITLMKGFIGSGILYLPNAYYVGGWGFTSVSILTSCIMSVYCVNLLLEAKEKLNANSYMDIGTKTLG